MHAHRFAEQVTTAAKQRLLRIDGKTATSCPWKLQRTTKKTINVFLPQSRIRDKSVRPLLNEVT